MTTTRVRAQALATVATLAAGVVVAATSAPSSAVPQAGGRMLALIQRAPESLSTYASLKETLTIAVRANGHTADIVAHGVVTPDGRSCTFSYSFPDPLPSFDLEVVDGIAYAPLPLEKRPLADGKPYVSLDVSGLAQQQVNPGGAAAMLRLLAGAHGTVADRGAATVDGTPTRHYFVTVDVQEAMERIPADLRPQVDVTALGPTLPVDVWLDGDGTVRQLRSVLHTASVDVTQTLVIHGSSQPLHVVAPAPADVFRAVDARQFTRILSGG